MPVSKLSRFMLAVMALAALGFAAMVFLARRKEQELSSTAPQPSRAAERVNYSHLHRGPVAAPRVPGVVLRVFKHDAAAFTQGLVYSASGSLYESTGWYGQSTLRKVDLASGRVTKKAKLHARLFGEGLTILNGKLYMITWRARKGFVFDLHTFKVLQTFTIDRREGWGLTHDDSNLIMSDGSSSLFWLDPAKNFKITRTLPVYEMQGGQRKAVPRLNELEWIDGFVYANIWFSDSIAVISPRTGCVVQWIDFAGKIYPRHEHPVRRDQNAVFNGIALHPQSRTLVLTGKRWDKAVEAELPSLPSAAGVS